MAHQKNTRRCRQLQDQFRTNSTGSASPRSSTLSLSARLTPSSASDAGISPDSASLELQTELTEMNARLASLAGELTVIKCVLESYRRMTVQIWEHLCQGGDSSHLIHRPVPRHATNVLATITPSTSSDSLGEHSATTRSSSGALPPPNSLGDSRDHPGRSQSY